MLFNIMLFSFSVSTPMFCHSGYESTAQWMPFQNDFQTVTQDWWHTCLGLRLIHQVKRVTPWGLGQVDPLPCLREGPPKPAGIADSLAGLQSDALNKQRTGSVCEVHICVDAQHKWSFREIEKQTNKMPRVPIKEQNRQWAIWWWF